jgi:uncharacterized coiled-coil protein SlyX
MKTKNMTTLHLRKSIGRSPWRRGYLLIAVALCCFALLPAQKAFGVSPAPDGGYLGQNTAEGDNALFSLTSGGNNTAIGYRALYSDTTGEENTANGYQALALNTTGFLNTATGVAALFNNTTGLGNTATGSSALNRNTTGFNNTASGFRALYSNTTGGGNTANGRLALSSNTIGGGNTADGASALLNTTGSGNIALGSHAGDFLTTGSNNIDVGSEGVAAEANTIRIGIEGTQTAAFIAGIANATVTGSAVYIDTASGQLGLVTSSARFKDGIRPMGDASEALLALRPVTFRYKKNIDPKGAPQFGLVAEEVAKVNPALVVRDAKGEVFTVRYEAVNAMLLNEFLKEHRTVQEQEATISQLKTTVAKQDATIAQQQKGMETVTARLNEQAAQIQRVSAQLEASNSAPQVVTNP